MGAVTLDDRIVRLTFVPLRLLQLASRFHKVFLDAIVTVRTDRKHASFCGHISQIRPVEAIRQLDDRLIVQLITLGDRPRVDFKNLEAALFIRQRDLNLPVNTSWS